MKHLDNYVREGLPKLRVCPKCKKAWLYGERKNGIATNRFKINCKCNYAYRNSEWCIGKSSAIKDWNKRMKFRLLYWLKDKFMR